VRGNPRHRFRWRHSYSCAARCGTKPGSYHGEMRRRNQGLTGKWVRVGLSRDPLRQGRAGARWKNGKPRCRNRCRHCAGGVACRINYELMRIGIRT